MAYIEETLILNQDLTVENEKQLVDILFPVVFGASLNNRKDSYSLKLNIDTGGDDCEIFIYTSHQDLPISMGVVNSSGLTEHIFDISDLAGITKYWQVRLVGLLSDFKLTEVSIDFDNRPEPVTFTFLPWLNAGPSKKRVRVWPVTLDSLGDEVTIIPYVDNSAQPSLEVSSVYPQTFLYQFTTDVFGIDYAISIRGCEVFELYKLHDPVGVQVLPIAKRFDQVGSAELFRYGKVKSFMVRLIAFGGTQIPYTLYFEDQTKVTGTIDVANGREDTYFIGVPKTTAGQIIRIELGPTSFDFHRFDIKVQCAKSGADTEMIWVVLE